MYRKLCDEYNSYFNVGTALCSFFLMNENDVGLYIENIKSCLLQIKNSNKNIEIVPEYWKTSKWYFGSLKLCQANAIMGKDASSFQEFETANDKRITKIKRQKVLDVIQ